MNKIVRNTGFYLIIFLVTVGIVQFISNQNNQQDPLLYSDFIESLQKGEIEEVTVRAARALVRNEHCLVRSQNFGALPHKVHAAEHDHIRVGFGGLLGQQEGVPAKIGNLLNFVPLIIMRKNDGISLFL